MARKEVEAEDLGNLFKFAQHGQCLDGLYLGTREVDGQFGRQTLYDVKGADGVVYSAPGSAGLSPKMAKIEPGVRVWITYVDDKETGKLRDGTAKNPMKVFKVEVDDAPAAPPPAAQGETNGAAPRKAPF